MTLVIFGITDLAGAWFDETGKLADISNVPGEPIGGVSMPERIRFVIKTGEFVGNHRGLSSYRKPAARVARDVQRPVLRL
ncbi:MAG TPA: hypothetical protein VHW24_05475 [Bryobacteraceae bacterium]|jgi:hypothetical protein|nr:hypothetical protein [Bryobacteraceae bacterium]